VNGDDPRKMPEAKKFRDRKGPERRPSRLRNMMNDLRMGPLDPVRGMYRSSKEKLLTKAKSSRRGVKNCLSKKSTEAIMYCLGQKKK